MSGELRTSQFRWTTTADDDFVIGNPNDIAAYTTKALVFQVTQTPGWAANPHFRCVHSGGSPGTWSFIMNDGTSDLNFSPTNIAYLPNVNVFTNANTFNSTVSVGTSLTVGTTLGVIGTSTLGVVNAGDFTCSAFSSNGLTASLSNSTYTHITGPAITLGTASASGTLTINADTTIINSITSFTVTNNTILSGNLTVNGGTTAINSTTVNITAPVITLNVPGGAISTSGIAINDSGNTVGFWKATPTGWQMLVPNAYAVSPTNFTTFIPSTTTAPVLTLPTATGTLARLGTDILNQVLTGYSSSGTTLSASDSILTSFGLLDAALSGAGGSWGLTGSDIWYTAGNVGVGTNATPDGGIKLWVVGGSIINYGGGVVTSNTAYGTALQSGALTGTHNTGIGNSTLVANTTGSSNTAVGSIALTANTTGYNNTAVGYGALTTNIVGTTNTAVGYYSLKLATGSDNTALGANTLIANTTGASNIAIGSGTLSSNTTGSNNTAIGYACGSTQTANSMCTFIGANTTTTGGPWSNSTAIGYGATITASNQITLGSGGESVIAHGGSVTGCQVATLTTSFIPAVNLYDNFVITATSGSALVIGAPTGVLGIGQTINIIYIQPAAGSIVTPTWNAVYKFFGTKNISTTLGGKSLISCMWDGTYWLCTSVKDPA